MVKRKNLRSGSRRMGQESLFPLRMIVFTCVMALLVVAANYGYEWMNETFNLMPAFRVIIIGLLVLVTVTAWVFWLLFFSPMSFVKRYGIFAILVLLVGGLGVLYKPVTGGDLGISRWEPRFWEDEKRLAQAEVPSPVDLSRTSSADFNQFLGSDRNGVVNRIRLAEDWRGNNAPRLVWRQSIGEGWSGFVAVNGFAITQEQRGADECVSCYDILSGRMQWIYKSPRRHRDSANLGHSGPRATPLIHEGRVYTQGATGAVTCLNGETGRLIWEIDLVEILGIQMIPSKDMLQKEEYSYENSSLAWGRAGSPMMVGDRLIVTGGGPRGGPFKTILALDKDTGAEIWSGGEEMIAYGSPALMTLAGKKQIVLVAESKAMGFSAEDGTVLWTHDRLGTSDANANCSQVTYVDDSSVLLSKGYSMGGELLTIDSSPSGMSAKSVWNSPRVLKTKMTSPVIHNGHAFSLSDGFLECTEVKSGIRKWKKRGRFGDGQILLVQDKLLVHGEDGTLHLYRTDTDEAVEVDMIRTINGVCWNTMCLYDRYLLVRSDVEAACFELMLGLEEQKEKKEAVPMNKIRKL